jgi:hypothetical protein
MEAEMAKIDINLDDLSEETTPPVKEKLQALAAPLPSPHRAKIHSLRDAPRVQFAFSNVPKPIKDSFVAAAKKRGVTQKEFLYDCLRAGGLSIPSNKEIDGRKR